VWRARGKDINLAFPKAWRYRGYVIAAFNKDQPHDQLLREQLAAGLFPAKNDQQRAEQLIATGFLAPGTKSVNQANSRQFALDLADEQIVVAKLYPWMICGDAVGAKSWEISFTDSGLPVRLEPRREAVSQPEIRSATPSKFPLTYVTKGYVTGPSKNPAPTPSDPNFLRLASGEF
jgi:hypothetical protein